MRAPSFLPPPSPRSRVSTAASTTSSSPPRSSPRSRRQPTSSSTSASTPASSDSHTLAMLMERLEIKATIEEELFSCVDKLRGLKLHSLEPWARQLRVLEETAARVEGLEGAAMEKDRELEALRAQVLRLEADKAGAGSKLAALAASHRHALGELRARAEAAERKCDAALARERALQQQIVHSQCAAEAAVQGRRETEDELGKASNQMSLVMTHLAADRKAMQELEQRAAAVEQGLRVEITQLQGKVGNARATIEAKEAERRAAVVEAKRLRHAELVRVELLEKTTHESNALNDQVADATNAARHERQRRVAAEAEAEELRTVVTRLERAAARDEQYAETFKMKHAVERDNRAAALKRAQVAQQEAEDRAAALEARAKNHEAALKVVRDEARAIEAAGEERATRLEENIRALMAHIDRSNKTLGAMQHNRGGDRGRGRGRRDVVAEARGIAAPPPGDAATERLDAEDADPHAVTESERRRPFEVAATSNGGFSTNTSPSSGALAGGVSRFRDPRCNTAAQAAAIRAEMAHWQSQAGMASQQQPQQQRQPQSLLVESADLASSGHGRRKLAGMSMTPARRRARARVAAERQRAADMRPGSAGAGIVGTRSHQMAVLGDDDNDDDHVLDVDKLLRDAAAVERRLKRKGGRRRPRQRS